MIDHPDPKIKKNDRLHPGRRLCELKASGDFEMKGPHDRKTHRPPAERGVVFSIPAKTPQRPLFDDRLTWNHF
jgi:hypothetical protein